MIVSELGLPGGCAKAARGEARGRKSCSSPPEPNVAERKNLRRVHWLSVMFVFSRSCVACRSSDAAEGTQSMAGAKRPTCGGLPVTGLSQVAFDKPQFVQGGMDDDRSRDR